MRLLRTPEPFDHPAFLFEPKLDGFRALALIRGHRCELISRNGHTFKQWPQLAEELAHAVRAHTTVRDGEICCLEVEPDGRTHFNKLLFRRDWPFFYAFDVLSIEGDDVTDLPLLERKRRLLAALIAGGATPPFLPLTCPSFDGFGVSAARQSPSSTVLMMRRPRPDGKLIRNSSGGPHMARRAAMALTVASVSIGSATIAQEDKYFDSAGVRIHYVDQGTGEPVVLLHGQTSSLDRAWINTGVFANLAKDHRVIAMDLRGYGKSDKPHDPDAYGEHMGQDVVRLLDHLKTPRAHIVSYSMGNAVSGKLLTTNPERYLTAILGGGSARRTSTVKDREEAEQEAAELTSDSPVPFRSFISRTTPSTVGRTTLSEEEIRKQSDDLLARNDPRAIAAFLRSRHLQSVTDAQLAAVKVPVLALVGSEDPALGAVKNTTTVMPQLAVIVINGATHMGDTSALVRSEFVNEIRRFIASHRSGSLR